MTLAAAIQNMDSYAHAWSLVTATRHEFLSSIFYVKIRSFQNIAGFSDPENVDQLSRAGLNHSSESLPCFGALAHSLSIKNKVAPYPDCNAYCSPI